MSVLTYNGIQLPYCFTTRLRQEAVSDDVSNTDWIATRYDITVQTILNQNYLTSLAPFLYSQNGGVVPTNPADIVEIVKFMLLQRRKTLSMKFNGVELIPQPQTDPNTGLQIPGSVDVSNGPVPDSCEFTFLTNQTWLMTYHIVAEYWFNPSRDSNCNPNWPRTNLNGSVVLYNRWTERVDIDNANYTKRIREGKFRIRSDNTGGIIADMVRSNFAIVGVPQGFLRDSSVYTVSPDGLTVSYTVTDREVFKLPPYPAFEADGDYIESITDYGAKRWAEVRVRLKGDKLTPRQNLLQTAVSVATSKLSISQDNPQLNLNCIHSGVVMMKLYENEVECRMRGLLTPRQNLADSGKNTFVGAWGINYNSFVTTPGSEQSDQPPQPAYLDYGSAGILLQAAAYYDPSLANALDPTGGQMQEGVPPGMAGVVSEGTTCNPTTVPGTPDLTSAGIQPSGTLPQYNNPATVNVGTFPSQNPDANYTDKPPTDPNSFAASIWVDYQIHNHYEGDQHIYMLPLTSTAGTPSGNTAAFCQLAMPTVLWIADWTASKTGEQPIYPDLTPQDNAWVLLDAHYGTVSLALAPDGKTFIYRLNGTYIYGNMQPSPAIIDEVKFGIPPWMTAIPDDRFLSEGWSQGGLLDFPPTP